MNFEGYSVIIYDVYGVPLKNAKVLIHDATENYIEILKHPDFHNGMGCELIILSEPAPYAYSGVVRTNTASTTNIIITLFKGKVKENRNAKRFKLTGTAELIHYIDDKKYDLHKPIKVNLINISASGVRFKTRINTLSNDDRFDLRLEIGSNDRVLEAKVVNSSVNGTETAEYGCLFLGDVNG